MSSPLHLPPLETRQELREKLDKIRQQCDSAMYGSLILIGVITQNFFMPFLLFIPAWIVNAFVYTKIDDYHEAKYLNAILERKRLLENMKGRNNR